MTFLVDENLLHSNGFIFLKKAKNIAVEFSSYWVLFLLNVNNVSHPSTFSRNATFPMFTLLFHFTSIERSFSVRSPFKWKIKWTGNGVAAPYKTSNFGWISLGEIPPKNEEFCNGRGDIQGELTR